jgi:hypothetical protein
MTVSLPGSPVSLKALNFRRGVVGCNGMFVLLASLLWSCTGSASSQTNQSIHFVEDRFVKSHVLSFVCERRVSF